MTDNKESILSKGLHDLHRNFFETYKRLRNYVTDSGYRILKERERHSELLGAVENIDLLRDGMKTSRVIPEKDACSSLMVGIIDHKMNISAQQPALLYEMAYVYSIATFEAFLLDVFTLLLTCKPDLIANDVRAKATTDKSTVAMAKKDARELCTGRIKDRMKKYMKRFGIDLLVEVKKSGFTAKDFMLWWEKRHSLVHRGGRVDKYMTDLDDTGKLSEATTVKIGYKEWQRTADVTAKVADSVFWQIGKMYCTKPPARYGWAEKNVPKIT